MTCADPCVLEKRSLRSRSERQKIYFTVVEFVSVNDLRGRRMSMGAGCQMGPPHGGAISTPGSNTTSDVPSLFGHAWVRTVIAVSL
jgi:hypothetical protein